MKTQKTSKRLQLSTETLRTLTADDVANVIGGAVPNNGGHGGGPVGFTNSISISVGGGNCCNCG